MKNLAIIPARIGSKRIPKKNIKQFLGKPIIAYSIEAAIQSQLFDEVMVSTDSSEIADVAIKYGASVPFFRSKKNSDDFSGPGDVVHEVIEEYDKMGKHFMLGCCIYSTAPLLSKESLKKGFDLLQNSDFDTVFPVVKFSSPIWRSYLMNETNEVSFNFPEYEKYRSQDLPNSYYDAGQFYWFYVSKISELSNKNIFGMKKGAIIIDENESQDIDNESDWIMAELKAKYIDKSGI